MRKDGKNMLIPVDEIESRSGERFERVMNFLTDDRRKIDTCWDGTPAVSWQDAAWVCTAMAEADEQARRKQAESEAKLARGWAATYRATGIG
jgi:hypothetical protein